MKLCARANMPYAQALAAGMAGSVGRLERTMLQCAAVMQRPRNATSSTGNSTTPMDLSIQFTTLPCKSMFWGTRAGISGYKAMPIKSVTAIRGR